jgi:hypothetical protein
VINLNPLVSIIILNWNGWQDTLECLESVFQIDYPNYQVILVDNNSQDQSLEKIRKYTQGKITVKSPFFIYNPNNKPMKITELTKQETEQPTDNIPEANNHLGSNDQLILIINDTNYGFAEGNNIAIKYTQQTHNPDYILLLNNDTLVTPEFLTQMVKVAEIDGKVGMVGCKLLNADNPRIIDSTGHVISWGRIVDRGHGEVDNGQYDNELIVMGAMAACALYKKEMLMEVGLLDTSYVILGEDADFSWRAHNHGWNALYAPDAVVYHKRGRSITKKSIIPKMTVLSLKNTVKYVTRYGNFYNKLLFLLIITKEGLFVLIGSLIKRNEINKGEYFHTLMESYAKIFKSL